MTARVLSAQQVNELREFTVVHQQRLYALAYALSGNQHDALDLVQDALFKLAEHWDTTRSPYAYCRRSIHNRFLDVVRSSRRQVLLAEPPDDLEHRPDEQMDPELEQALRSLRAKQQLVLVLRYVYDLSDEQISAETGLSRPAVRTNAKRGLDRLRRLLTASP